MFEQLTTNHFYGKMYFLQWNFAEKRTDGFHIIYIYFLLVLLFRFIFVLCMSIQQYIKSTKVGMQRVL